MLLFVYIAHAGGKRASERASKRRLKNSSRPLASPDNHSRGALAVPRATFPSKRLAHFARIFNAHLTKFTRFAPRQRMLTGSGGAGGQRAAGALKLIASDASARALEKPTHLIKLTVWRQADTLGLLKSVELENKKRQFDARLIRALEMRATFQARNRARLEQI